MADKKLNEASEVFSKSGLKSRNAAILASNAAEGNKEAFEKLVEMFQEQIFKMVFYRTGIRMDAEDLTQEIFTLAFYRITRLKEPEKFRPWLFRIAVNRVHDHNRRKKFAKLFRIGGQSSEKEFEDIYPDWSHDALDRVLKKNFWRCVLAFLEKLSHGEREVFSLRFLDNMTLREIGFVLNKSESTVKTHLYRALKKFKKASGLNALLSEVSLHHE